MSSSLDHIGEEIAVDVTHHDAALHRILTKLRIFDDGGGYVSQGFRTCASWLSWRVNWSLNTAREHVRVANALGGLPLIDRAFECGQLSYCKVRALTRVATGDNEAALVEMASHMTGDHLERLCRKYAAAKYHDDPTGTSRPTTPADDIDRRYVHRRDREDGMVVFEAVLHPDEADIVSAALERIAKERCRASSPAADAAANAVTSDAVADTTNVSAETLPSLPTILVRQPKQAFDRATALVEMSQQVLRGTSPDRAPVDIMIAIPLDQLTSHSADIKACCTSAASPTPSTDVAAHLTLVGNGTFVTAAAARRLACDAGIIALVEDANGNALSIGRKTRSIPAPMKRAMLRRDCKCRYPGCNARAFLEGHHLEHWADGGPTNINNLISLCSYHHRFVHEYGFRLELDVETNTVTAYDPNNRRIPAVARTEAPSDLGWPNILRRNEHSITAATQPTWDATPVDYGDIVDVILRAEARAEYAAADVLDELEEFDAN